MQLSASQVKQFEQDGILIVKNLLTVQEVALIKQRISWVGEGNSPIPSERLQVEPRVKSGELQTVNYIASLRKMSHLAFIDEVFATHARNHKILDCIQALLGPDIKLIQDQLFMKPPAVGSRQPYHQDQPCGFHIEPPHMVTCWAALDEATVENGCLWMLPGTHRFGVLDREKWQEYEQRTLEGNLPQERAIELKIGDCSFHHGHILHSSRPNLTEKQRWGYATHYVSARCRFTGPPGEINDAMLMRGNTIPGCI